MNNQCPWCGSEKSRIHLKLKDEFLTKEEFEIHVCQKCSLLFTTPRPNTETIGKYYQSEEYYSHQENKTGFIPKLYEKVKSINLKTKYKMATKGMQVGECLDIGCGVGDFLHTLEQKGWNCTAIEPSESARAIAAKRIKAKLYTSKEQENLPAGQFDLITMWHVLEHVDNLRWQIAQLERLLKPGGRVVIALPNYKSYDGQFYKEKWGAYDVPRHLNHFCKETIRKIFASTNLEQIKTEKLIWDAYYISFMSENYKKHQFPLLRGTYRGLISNIKARGTGEWSSMVYIFQKK